MTVPFDPGLLPALAALPAEPPLSTRTLAEVRAMREAAIVPLAEAAAGLPVTVSDHGAPGVDGAPEVTLTVIRPSAAARVPACGAAVFSIHGGGMVLDNRFDDNDRLIALVGEHGLVAATVEYRLAPEHPAPAALEDCYAGLRWFAGHADELGFDSSRLVVMGGSAGGGLAAGVSLMARDLGGPLIAGQMLLCPMLDDRPQTASAAQFEAAGTWQGPNNRFGWSALLGADAGRPDSPGAPSYLHYAAPARATDVSNLPSAFIEVGAAELFRDEDVAYATRIWAAGGAAELHVWSGAFHGFDRIAPDAAVSRAALAARDSWLRRVLQLGADQPRMTAQSPSRRDVIPALETPTEGSNHDRRP